jgi:hypothetical protein
MLKSLHFPRKKSALGKIDTGDNERSPIKLVSEVTQGEHVGAVEPDQMKLISRSVRLFGGVNDNILLGASV